MPKRKAKEKKIVISKISLEFRFLFFTHIHCVHRSKFVYNGKLLNLFLKHITILVLPCYNSQNFFFFCVLCPSFSLPRSFRLCNMFAGASVTVDCLLGCLNVKTNKRDRDCGKKEEEDKNQIFRLHRIVIRAKLKKGLQFNSFLLAPNNLISISLSHFNRFAFYNEVLWSQTLFF